MKLTEKISLLAATIICSIAINCGAVELELKQAVEGPSYEETVKFLESTVVTGSNWGSVSFKISVVDNCVIKVVSQHRDNKPKSEVTDMKHVTSVEVEEKQASTGSWGFVNYYAPQQIRRENSEGERRLLNESFIAADMRTAGRLAKALNHLRKLCGANDSAF